MEPPVWTAKKKQADMLLCQTPEGDLGRPGAPRKRAQMLPKAGHERASGGLTKKKT